MSVYMSFNIYLGAANLFRASSS